MDLTSLTGNKWIFCKNHKAAWLHLHPFVGQEYLIFAVSGLSPLSETPSPLCPTVAIAIDWNALAFCLQVWIPYIGQQHLLKRNLNCGVIILVAKRQTLMHRQNAKKKRIGPPL